MHRLPTLLAHRRTWMLAILVIALLAAHGVIVRYMVSNQALSGAVLSGVVVVLVIKHLGLLGSLYALVRRRSRGE